MAKDDIDRLVKNGLIGAALGALFSRDKEEGAIIGAILGAVFTATNNANRAAQKTNQPVMIVESGNIYKLMPNGEKIFIKELPRNETDWPLEFKLK